MRYLLFILSLILLTNSLLLANTVDDFKAFREGKVTSISDYIDKEDKAPIIERNSACNNNITDINTIECLVSYLDNLLPADETDEYYKDYKTFREVYKKEIIYNNTVYIFLVIEGLNIDNELTGFAYSLNLKQRSENNYKLLAASYTDYDIIARIIKGDLP